MPAHLAEVGGYCGQFLKVTLGHRVPLWGIRVFKLNMLDVSYNVIRKKIISQWLVAMRPHLPH